jgi:hypothetical protein
MTFDDRDVRPALRPLDRRAGGFPSGIADVGAQTREAAPRSEAFLESPRLDTLWRG